MVTYYFPCFPILIIMNLNHCLDIQVIYQLGGLVFYLLLNILVVPKVSTVIICSEYFCAYSLFAGLFPQSKT